MKKDKKSSSQEQMEKIQKIVRRFSTEVPKTKVEKNLELIAIAIFVTIVVIILVMPSQIENYRTVLTIMFLFSSFMIAFIDCKSSLRTGKIRGRDGIYDLESHPKVFWFFFSVRALIAFATGTGFCLLFFGNF